MYKSIVSLCCLMWPVVMVAAYTAGGYGMGGYGSIFDSGSIASYQPSHSSGGYSGGGGGYSGYGKSYEEPHYPPQPYKFGYDIKDGYGGSLNQKEEGDEYGNKRGSYGYVDSYGIYRQVDYVADKDGFRATIKTNEPGTANQNPAAVYIHSEAPPVQYEQAHAAPAYKSPSAAPMYSSPKNNYMTGQFYKSATHPIPSYSSLLTKTPIYQMPAMYLSPKTVFKNIPY